MSGTASYKLEISEEDEDFIKEHASLVKRIAYHLLARLPSVIQVDDLIQAGMIGLIEAARNFDENKGAAFLTYAGIRIRGAMLDEIRKGDWTPRSVHRNSRRVAKAMREIEHATGRDARDYDIAASLGISLEEYHQILQDANGAKIYAFEDLGMSEEAFDFSAHYPMNCPLEGIQKEDIKKRLANEIAKLPDREKLVLALYYDEELNLREVGEVLGVSESRISQIHTQAMIRLKSRLIHFE